MQEKSQAPFIANQERTCVGCGQATNLANLVRTVRSAQGLVFDGERRRPGRGAWVHPRGPCLEGAVKRGFSRSFRTQVSGSLPELWRSMVLAAEQEAARLLRGGYRGGQVLAEPPRVLEAVEAGKTEALVVAPSQPAPTPEAPSEGGAKIASGEGSSASQQFHEGCGAPRAEEAVLQHAARVAMACGKAVAWGSAHELGRLTHRRGPVSIAAVVDKHLAMRLFRTSAIVSAPGPERNQSPVVRGGRKASVPQGREKDVKAR